MGDEGSGARNLDVRVEQLYRRVSTGLHHDRTKTVWLRFEVSADSDPEALALVRDQVRTGSITAPPCARPASDIRGGMRRR